MNRAQQLIALRNRKPDSIAPDGSPLKVILRSVGHLSKNEKDVIVERAMGWEKADCATLARIFCTHPQTISYVIRNHQTKSDAGETSSPSGLAAEHVTRNSHNGSHMLGSHPRSDCRDNALSCDPDSNDFVPHAGVYSREDQDNHANR